MQKLLKYVAIAAVVAAGFTIVPVAAPAGPSPQTKCKSCGAWNGGVTGTGRCADCEKKNARAVKPSISSGKKQ